MELSGFQTYCWRCLGWTSKAAWSFGNFFTKKKKRGVLKGWVTRRPWGLVSNVPFCVFFFVVWTQGFWCSKQNKQFFRTFQSLKPRRKKKHVHFPAAFFGQKPIPTAAFRTKKWPTPAERALTLTCPPARTRNFGSTGIFVGKQKNKRLPNGR